LFQTAYRQGMADKLGLNTISDDDELLAQELLSVMQEEKADFTLVFRRLSELADSDNVKSKTVSPIFDFSDAFLPWLHKWQKRLADEPKTNSERQTSMFAVNPAFIARNHLVEEALEAAAIDGDFAPFHRLVERLAKPYDFDSCDAHMATPPQAEQVVQQTFCGT